MNNLFDTDMIDYQEFEKEIIDSIFYSLDKKLLPYGLKFKLYSEDLYSLFKKTSKDVEETTTGLYLKQSFKSIDTLTFCSAPTNTFLVNTIETSFEINSAIKNWKKASLVRIVINHLCYEYGGFEVIYINKDCCFKWTTPDEVVTLTLRHPDSIELFYYSYRISIIPNFD